MYVADEITRGDYTKRFALDITMTAYGFFSLPRLYESRVARPLSGGIALRIVDYEYAGTSGKNQMASETGSPVGEQPWKKNSGRGQSGKLACSKMIKCSPPA